jgi:hypothetical protein
MLRLVATVALLSAALPGRPADPVGSAVPVHARAGAPARRAARTLVTEHHWSQVLDGYAESLSERLDAALKSQGSAAPQDLHARVRRDLGDALPYGRMLEVHATELERRFSPAELKDISVFYEGATGQKLLRELPAVGEAVNGTFRELLAAAIPGIIQRNAPALAGQGGGEEQR